MAKDIGNKLANDGSEVLVPTSTGFGLGLILNHTSGVVNTITVDDGGDGYTASTPITIIHPTGTGCTADIATVDGNGAVLTITVNTGGTGYTNQGVLTQANVGMCALVELDWLDLNSGNPRPLRITDSTTNIKWYDNTDYTQYVTYQAIGLLGGMSEIEEGFDLQSYGISLTLSGIPKQFLEEAFSDASFSTAYQNRDCNIHIGFLDANHELIDEPIKIFSGQMDACQIEIGESIRLALTVNSRLVNWEIPRGGRFNTHDQQKWYPLDTGFDLIPELLRKELEWGGDGLAGSESQGPIGSSGGAPRENADLYDVYVRNGRHGN